jgi:hypothetical protein
MAPCFWRENRGRARAQLEDRRPPLPAVAVLWLIATAATVPQPTFSRAERTAVGMAVLCDISGGNRGEFPRAAPERFVRIPGFVRLFARYCWPRRRRVFSDRDRSADTVTHADGIQFKLSAPDSLRMGLYWWPVGFVLALVYFAVLFTCTAAARKKWRVKAINAPSLIARIHVLDSALPDQVQHQHLRDLPLRIQRPQQEMFL